MSFIEVQEPGASGLQQSCWKYRWICVAGQFSLYDPWGCRADQPKTDRQKINDRVVSRSNKHKEDQKQWPVWTGKASTNRQTELEAEINTDWLSGIESKVVKSKYKIECPSSNAGTYIGWSVKDRIHSDASALVGKDMDHKHRTEETYVKTD